MDAASQGGRAKWLRMGASALTKVIGKAAGGQGKAKEGWTKMAHVRRCHLISLSELQVLLWLGSHCLQALAVSQSQSCGRRARLKRKSLA
jgi:hypothetical protein